MSKISFYQVMNGEVIKYACQLLEKCFTNDMKTFVQVQDDIVLNELNKSLWTFAQKAFIPHGSDQDSIPERQPIYISTKSNSPINATVLMLIGVSRVDIKEYERVIIVIDGLNNSMLQSSKEFLESLRVFGHEVDYYIQNVKGGWSKS